MYRTWAVTGGLGHVQWSSPPQNTASRTTFPLDVATALGKDLVPREISAPGIMARVWPARRSSIR